MSWSLIVFPNFLHLDFGFPFALYFRSHQPISFFEFYANNFNCDTENSSFLVYIQGNNYQIIFMLCLIL